MLNNGSANIFPRQQEDTAVMEEAFSTRSVLRCYKQNQLAEASSALQNLDNGAKGRIFNNMLYV
jgi:hypothetical protein